MVLTKFEQSGFILENSTGFRLAWDIASYTPLADLAGMDPVDAVLVSHIHPDHFSPEHIAALKPKDVYVNQECNDALGEQDLPYAIHIIKPGHKLNLQDIAVECFAADHGPNTNGPVQDNMGFIFAIEGQTIYFAGDMFYPSGPAPAKLAVDIALIPIGGFYTFAPPDALAYANSFQKIGTVVPIHYDIKPEACPEFVKLAEGKLSYPFKVLEPGQTF